jgi:hypothetical protein
MVETPAELLPLRQSLRVELAIEMDSIFNSAMRFPQRY